MEEEWSHISHILEREEEEVQAAMRVEVGATHLCTTHLDKTEFSCVFTEADIIAEMENSKF